VDEALVALDQNVPRALVAGAPSLDEHDLGIGGAH
jgi:hypothetical protein